MDTAIRRIGEKEARSLGLTIISDEWFRRESRAEARYMDYPRAIAGLGSINTYGITYFRQAVEKAMLEVFLIHKEKKHVQATRNGKNELDRRRDRSMMWMLKR